MYGYRQANEGLMTNLNSISSSLSSIDTIGRRGNAKASADNLITQRSNSIASTSLLWRGSKDERYSTATNGRNKSRHQAGSEIYYDGGRNLTKYCLNSETALNFTLLPLLLLTITRQVFDFLGQIWLQIILNFFTTILIIVGLFGIRQHRVSYLYLYALWALFNTVWNIIVICIHTKIRDVGVGEDALSFYTGTSSWWHSNGPGCLPYNISSIQSTISILQPNIITGCRIDYHTIEATQAALHSLLSLLTALFCCCVVSNIRRNFHSHSKAQSKIDKGYRLNNLTNNRSKVNQDPYPKLRGSRYGAQSGSLRRAANKTSSRSSQHSLASVRSARRRSRLSTSEPAPQPTPRGSTSSMQRSQKYGSLSSRRSSKKERRGDISSLAGGATGERSGQNHRTRQSSVSSVEYLPSYQPPHSSSANLLSSYGEISSIDSYNNHVGHRGAKNRAVGNKMMSNGNSNPTYTGSRSSICSHNTNVNNYDDLSYIYGNNSTRNSASLYGASSSGPSAVSRQRNQIYRQQNNTNSMGKKNGIRSRDQQASSAMGKSTNAENVQLETDDRHLNVDAMTKPKLSMTNGSFHSFSASNQQGTNTQFNASNKNQLLEINNNHMTTNNQEIYNETDHMNRHFPPPDQNSFDFRSRVVENPNLATSQAQIYNNQRNSRHQIYSDHTADANSETPI